MGNFIIIIIITSFTNPSHGIAGSRIWEEAEQVSPPPPPG